MPSLLRDQIIVTAVVVLALAFGVRDALSAMPREDYLKSLRIADQYVQKRKALADQNRSGALTASVLPSLVGRPYRVGDWWEVAAVHAAPEQFRMTAEIAGIFRYEVKEVTTGESPGVRIVVTQLSADGFTPIDPAIDRVNLSINGNLRQTEKSYSTGLAPHAVKVSPDVRTRISRLELFPLDLPDVSGAERAERRVEAPPVPGALQSVAARAGFRVDAARAAWYEQDDFFGRPVRFIWQQGDPWPAYLKTSQGVSILLRKGEGAQ